MPTLEQTHVAAIAQASLPRSPEPDVSRRRTVQLRIEVCSLRFRSADGEFAVVDALASGGERLVLTGAIGYFHEGEEVEVEGRWREHPRHGQRFEVVQAIHSEPQTEAGLMAALSTIKHIGPRGAAFLYERYGLQALTMVDRAPDQRLREVPGIGRVRIGEALASWEGQRAQRALRIFLGSHGVAAAVASRIFRAWGARSVAQLQAAPYSITALPGVGFSTADALAASLGIACDAPERLDAGLLHALEQAETEGHCYLPRGEIERRAAGLLSASHPPGTSTRGGMEAALIGRIDVLCKDGRLIPERDRDGVELIYAAEMNGVESRLGEDVRERLRARSAPSGTPARQPRAGAFVPTDEQWKAVRIALEHRLSILTGGPGTGKTTSMRVLVEQVRGSGGSVRLCAPTGKAARRLASATGEPASTIHRLLEWVPGIGFGRGRANRIDELDLLIVDEASMLSVRLAEALFAAVGPKTHVLLVGDVDQLAAVGPGRVLDDLIVSGQVPVTALDEVFRQAGRSLIVRAAHAINEGSHPLVSPARSSAAGTSRRASQSVVADAGHAHADDANSDDVIRDFFLIKREREQEVFAEVVSLACERLAGHFGLDPRIDIQVLSPMRRGEVGIEALNAELRARLNPGGAPVPGTPLRLGDRVIQTRNDHEHEFMNGEVGLVAHCDHQLERVTLACDDGRELRLPLTALDSVEPAYAISIHKSQGSQAPAIIVALARSQRIMLTRNLLYTAVTRAESVCVVVAQPGALELALGRRDARRRYTRLREIVTA